MTNLARDKEGNIIGLFPQPEEDKGGNFTALAGSTKVVNSPVFRKDTEGNLLIPAGTVGNIALNTDRPPGISRGGIEHASYGTELALQDQQLEQAFIQTQNIKLQQAFQKDFFESFLAQTPDADQLKNFSQQLFGQEQARAGVAGETLTQAQTQGQVTAGLPQTQVSGIDTILAQLARVAQLPPEQQALFNEQQLGLAQQALDLQAQTVEDSANQGLLSREAFRSQLDSISGLRDELDRQAQFDSGAQQQFNDNVLNLRSDQIGLQQQTVERLSQEGKLTKDLFAAQNDAVKALQKQIQGQPSFDPDRQEAFDNQQLDIQTRLADLQQQEVNQSLDRASQEDEFFAAQLDAVKNTGQATPEQTALIKQAISGAKAEGISSIDLDRDLNLQDLSLAKGSRLSGLDSDIASAISGINSDVFQRVSTIEADTGTALENIDRLSIDALEQVRDILAPSRGLRPTDTPITDRGFEIAGEATRAKGSILQQSTRAKGDLTGQAGRQIGDIQAQAERERANIGRESEILRSGAVSQADRLRAGLTGGLEEAGASAQLNFPLQVAQLQGNLAAQGVSGIREDQAFQQQLAQAQAQNRQNLPGQIGQSIGAIASPAVGQINASTQFQQQLAQAQEEARLNFPVAAAQASGNIAGQVTSQATDTSQFQQQLAQLQEQQRLNFPISAVQASSGIAGQAINASQAAKEFQAQLSQNATANRLSLASATGGLGLGLAQSGPNIAGTIGALVTPRSPFPPQQSQSGNNTAGILGGIGGLLGGIAAVSCWVAREVYGDNPDWLKFRHFVLNDAPSWFRDFYLENGEQIAEAIKDEPEVKAVIRNLMDEIIYA